MRRSSIKQEQRKYMLLQTVQWIIFGLLILAAFVLSTAGSHLKPLLLLSLALCISSHTGEIQATAIGMVCGFLTDIASGKLLGYNAVLFVVFCVAVSLLYNYILRQKMLNIVILTAVSVLIQGYLDYLFYYAIWGHEDVWLIYTNIILPASILTLLSSFCLYYPVKWIADKCGSRREQELEETRMSAYYDY